jgi:hypothetical protein
LANGGQTSRASGVKFGGIDLADDVGLPTNAGGFKFTAVDQP